MYVLRQWQSVDTNAAEESQNLKTVSIVYSDIEQKFDGYYR